MKIQFDQNLSDEIYSLDEIKSVVLNEWHIPTYYFSTYEGNKNEILLLIDIIARAQNADSNDPKFIEFVRKNAKHWRRWVLLAKHYRGWCQMVEKNKKEK